MSSAPEVFPFGNPSEPAFETALRGYEKKQVERYVQTVEAEVAALVAEREELYGQIGLLNQHIQQLQHEMNSRRLATPAAGGDVSYRHLGARAEQILALAEEQAAEIRERVSRELAEREAVLNRTRAELDVKAADAVRNFETALAARKAEEEAAAAKRRSDLEAEITAAKEYAARVRSDVDALYTAALQESTRVGDATKAYADKVRAETEAYAALVRGQTDEELASLRTAAAAEATALKDKTTAEADTLREEAEAEFQRRKAEIEAELSDLRRSVDGELSQRRVEAEQVLAQRRVSVDDEISSARDDAVTAAKSLRA